MEQVAQKRDALLGAVNAAFWGTLKTSTNVSAELRGYASEVLQALSAGTASVSSPPAAPAETPE